MALPILKQYQESTDGSYIEIKHSALVWHYRNADPDLGNWQVRWGGCWDAGDILGAESVLLSWCGLRNPCTHLGAVTL